MCVTCGCNQNTAPPTALRLTDVQSERERDEQGSTKARSDAAQGVGLSEPVHPHTHMHADGTVHTHVHEGDHAHAKDDDHALDASQANGRDARTVALEVAVLSKNNMLAERNRGWFLGRGVFALNLMSAPGAGKTTLLECSIRALHPEVVVGVVEGDQATTYDAQRIRATGACAIQINTGTGCHLDAQMLADALERLQPPAGSLLVIENVGNLVCPALFDLGETARVVMCSVTEGEDKPLKYPHMFRAADVLVLSKIDLLPHLRVDLARMVDNARTVNPKLRVFALSAYSAEGLQAWYEWLRRCAHGTKTPA